MKFETHYKKSINNISKQFFESEYGYEIALFNHFIDSLIPTTDQNFIKLWRLNIKQNALQSKHDRKVHIKQLLIQVFDSIQRSNETDNEFSALENNVMEQFDYLNIITCDELDKKEQPFLGVTTSDESNFKYEVTLMLNNPSMFLLVAENGTFRVDGYSYWYETVTINGYNQELINYINKISIGE